MRRLLAHDRFVMYVYALAGFVLLFGGGELLVRGAVAVSRRFALSPLLIGMTVVAWCTSAPELVVSMGAALDGRSAIAIGNVVGSNIFNILGVLGASALIFAIRVHPASLRRDVSVMLGASVILALVAQMGVMGRITGLAFTAAIIAYVWYSYRAESRRPDDPSAELHIEESEEIEGPSSAWLGVAYFVGGLATLVIGSRLLIVGATDIARVFGVSEAAIGLTLIAVGTSLPELATSVVAAFRRHSDVAVGNVIGSNIFNIFGILGPTALVTPIKVHEQIASIDVWVMVAISVALVPWLLWRGSIGRLSGALFLGVYVAYAVFLLV